MLVIFKDALIDKIQTNIESVKALMAKLLSIRFLFHGALKFASQFKLHQ